MELLEQFPGLKTMLRKVDSTSLDICPVLIYIKTRLHFPSQLSPQFMNWCWKFQAIAEISDWHVHSKMAKIWKI